MNEGEKNMKPINMEPVNSIENKNPEELKQFIDSVDPNDKDSMLEIAKSLGKVVDKLTPIVVNSFTEKVIEKADPDTMSVMAENLDKKSVVDKMNDEVVNKFVDAASKINNISVMYKTAKSMKNIVNKVTEGTLKVFTEKVIEMNDPDTMSAMAENLDKDSVFNKMDDEVVNKFVKGASKAGDSYVMYKTAKSMRNVVYKVTKDTLKTFTEKAIEKNDPDTMSLLAKNVNVMNKLDESTKDMMNKKIDEFENIIDSDE